MKPTSKRDELITHGMTASAGYAIGRIALRLPPPQSTDRQGDPVTEHRRLKTALITAKHQLKRLRATTDKLGGQILQFQLELINDRQLVDPIVAHINSGQSAYEAWKKELDLQVADYLAAEDENFRARANDFVDLRDRILSLLHRTDAPPIPEGPDSIYVAEDLTPSRFLETDWSSFIGVALAHGSTASHVAILARARRVPMVIGLGEDIGELEGGARAILDADAGLLIQRPGVATMKKYERLIAKRRLKEKQDETYLPRPAMTASGKRIRTLINVDDPVSLEGVNHAFCDGIGLTRSELLFYNPAGLPNEEQQFQAYLNLLTWAKGKPVIIRTLDAGADKPIPGLTLEAETNPFMGLRGLRLSLARPDIFRLQLRALARAAAHGPLKVLLPMVTEPGELVRARELLSAEVSDLKRNNQEACMPPLGIMVEVPAAALRVHAFKADFFSIGSNDLIQYVTAACRDSTQMTSLLDPFNPAVLELIRRVAAYGAATGKEVSLCGDMAAVPEMLPVLLDTGIASFSVAPAALARVKAAVAQYGG